MNMLPLASQLDSEDVAVGSLDPLGTYALSEALATRIGSYGVRERQGNLRFLTICCIGWEVISALDPDLKPGDPSSTAEQAFEWIVVEALVQAKKAGVERDLNIPGIQKAQDALKQSLHLNADRYLSMPSTFGFFGVYRTLADYLGVVSFASEDGPILGPDGVKILDAWRRDQGLNGFGRERQVRGQDFYRAILACLRDTFREGMVVPNKAAFQFVQEFLYPGQVGGPLEADALKGALIEAGHREDDDHRRQLLRSMDEPAVVELMAGKEPGKERKFHRLLEKKASPSLIAALKGIEAYEGLVGLLHGAFDELRRSLTPESRLVPTDDVFKRSTTFAEAAKACPVAYQRAYDALADLGLAPRLSAQFEVFAKPWQPKEWLAVLLEHHERVQKHKPPAGKAPWFERQADKVGVRPVYRLDGAPRSKEDFVYFYRTTPIFNFLQSLKADRGKA